MNNPMINPLASSSSLGLLQESSNVQPLLRNGWANGHIRCHQGLHSVQREPAGISSSSSHGLSPNLGVDILLLLLESSLSCIAMKVHHPRQS